MASNTANFAGLFAAGTAGGGKGAAAAAAASRTAQMSFGFYALFKIVAVAVSFCVSLMITNNMAQLYTERVFVEEKNPPHLRNQVILWAVFAVVANLLILLGANVANNAMGKAVEGDWIIASAYDIVFAFLVAVVLLWGVSGIMYAKKYFYYKDDGLRAIRALKDITNWVATVLLLLPAGYFVVQGLAPKR